MSTGRDDVTGAGDLHGDEVLTSLDGVTSPVSYTRGPNGTIEVVMFMSEKGFQLVCDIQDEIGAEMEDVFARSLILYRKALKAVREGKSVGVASNPDVLDVQFVDL